MKKILCLILLSSIASAETLPEAVDNVGNSVDQVSTTTDALSQNVNGLIDKYKLTNAGKCALLVMGNSSSNSAPVYFVEGPNPISILQADIIVGPGITISGIQPGPVALNAGKSIQSAPVPGGERFIMFGLNQTDIASGQVATVTYDISGATTGPHIFS